ncbi:MAG: peroxiredoxin, partial [Odoribacter sp.]|nr:peroxiredoxin [Odoribacter sp.]
GKWSILFSHPSDFTPVCTSEFVTFGYMAKEFEDLNCQLVGLSIGGVYSHIAWLRAIKEKVEFRGMKNVDIRFPLIADQNAEIAKKYGMVHPGENTTMAVRAVFYIDPQGIIRAVIYYPLALGRNFAELKRVLVGLQAIDKYNVALPADWQPGEEVIAPTPGTYDAVDERMQAPIEGTHCSDWFFCLKKGGQEG